MRYKRASGILLHPTSLPSRLGIGDIGPSANAFVDFLAETGQHWWQVLPARADGGQQLPLPVALLIRRQPDADQPGADGGGRLSRRGRHRGRGCHDGPGSPDRLSTRSRCLQAKVSSARRSGRFEPAADPQLRLLHRESGAGWLDDFATYMAALRSRPHDDKPR